MKGFVYFGMFVFKMCYLSQIGAQQNFISPTSI